MFSKCGFNIQYFPLMVKLLECSPIIGQGASAGAWNTPISSKPNKGRRHPHLHGHLRVDTGDTGGETRDVVVAERVRDAWKPIGD